MGLNCRFVETDVRQGETSGDLVEISFTAPLEAPDFVSEDFIAKMKSVLDEIRSVGSVPYGAGLPFGDRHTSIKFLFNQDHGCSCIGFVENGYLFDSLDQALIRTLDMHLAQISCFIAERSRPSDDKEEFSVFRARAREARAKVKNTVTSVEVRTFVVIP